MGSVTLAFLALLAVAGRAPAPAADGNGLLWCIGEPDGSPMEFGLAEESWRGYERAYPRPVVFTVGKDRPAAWPYIHPSTWDKWAGGGRVHPFTLRFTLNAAPAGPLYLVVGQADAWQPEPEITVVVNGKEVGRRRVPAGSGSGSGEASGASKPAAMVFALPEGLVHAGQNTATLSLDDGSWILYDYVALSTRPDPPKLRAGAPSPELLAGPIRDVPAVIFATRSFLQEHWYANFSYFSTNPAAKAYGQGGRLCRLDLKTGAIRLLVDDPKGSVRDPCVDYSGKRILFSYRRGGTETYHLFEIGADGSGLRQVTDGPYDDIEPCYLPDGDLLFVSARARRWVNCWVTQVAVLYRCDRDGGHLRQLSANIEQDNTPWVLPDGRILYTRWEYIDRSQVNYHHLWAMNPDGTEQTVFFGNLHPGDVYIDAKPVPGTRGDAANAPIQVVLSRSPGHGQAEHAGALALLSPDEGPDHLPSLRSFSRGTDFRDPWALSSDSFLAARGNSLVLLDRRGRMATLYTLPREWGNVALHEPRPLVARPREPVIPNRVDLTKANGRFVVDNVAFGRSMAGVAPGEVKKLLVIESLPKPVNFTGGMDPMSYKGTFTLERVLGTVPVEADGSAYFEAPALRSLFFVALDGNDRAIKRMQSFTTVQPGETQGCLGCHEARTTAGSSARARRPLAVSRGPSRIEPIRGVPDVLDFPRDVQPILDRHCVSCHNPDRRDGGVLLTGDHGPMFSHSYYTLTVWKQIADGRNYARSNYPPRALGSGGSALMEKLRPSHHGVRVTPQEEQVVRLWLDVGAPYPGTYAALGCGMIGGYQINAQILENDSRWPETMAAQPAFARRCASCHTPQRQPIPRTLSDEIGLSFWEPDMNDPRLKHSRHLVFNLTRPEKSLLLLAPLAKSAGGYGLCRGAGVPAGDGALFAGTGDADYRLLLAMCQAGARRLGEIKRFDMPGFRPRPEYVRELQRYGVLPAAFDGTKEPLDVYAADRAYWRLFEGKPQ